KRFILHLKATGIDDLANLTTQIFAYQKTINIRSSKKLNNAHLNIVDMMGRTVYEQALVDGQNESIIVPLEDGVYLVQLVSDSGTEVEKVVLQ
ncbi:MAG: T9SS type A sorting domain-containing protein, partial [Bacteroidales bacterium]|nr:T9SS type A sorting domain-containing protein [Bacteroidales bacterium]